ncbi:endonuclease V, partial [Basidiobolus meristosporus CBS 931.73]
PYIPGFLAFREVHVLLELVEKLRNNKPEFLPQVLLVDGNGVLHPRGFGLASHLGVLTDIPTIGVAKNFLQINDGPELTMAKVKTQCHKLLQKGGDKLPLIGDSGTLWGMAVRTLDTTTNPIFISTGHRVSHETAVAIALHCSLYRIPEPIRQADLRTRSLIRRRQE